MVICLEQSADLHVAQLMLLPLTVSCFSKIQIGSFYLSGTDRLTWVVPEKGPLNGCLLLQQIKLFRQGLYNSVKNNRILIAFGIENPDNT